MRKTPIGSLALALCGTLLGCQGTPEPVAGCCGVLKLPDTVTCAKIRTAGPELASLAAALASAQPKECIVAAAGRYSGSVRVPTGVTLAAELGTVVELAGGTASVAAVTLAVGANLAGVRVIDAPGVGVSIAGGGSRMIGVTIERAGSAAIVAWCEEDCQPWEFSVLQQVVLNANAVGLWVHGTPLRMIGGVVSGNQSTGLAAGYGVVASHGARLEMTGTIVEKNEELGILIDGNLGTDAALDNVIVQKNLGRGVWAQAIAGTLSLPRLRLDNCTLEGNALVGIGARASSGIQIRGGRIGTTVLGKGASATPGALVDVGDGIGLFETTGEVRIENVTLDLNQRSQILIDRGSTGLSVTGGMITTMAGQLPVVVQNTTATVQAQMIVTPMPGQELPISAPTLVIPAR